MTRKLRTLGLTLAALLTLCGVAAPTTLAQFEVEKEDTTLTVGTNEIQSFKIKAGAETTIECTALGLDGATVFSKVTNSIAIEPTYTGCEKFLGQSVSVDTNGCDYVLHLTEAAEAGAVDIECPTATGIQITVGSICTYEIDSQTGLGSVTYKNVGMSSTQEVELQPNVTGITSTRTTSDFPFICPNGSAEGTYTGSFVLTGEKEGGHAGTSVEPPGVTLTVSSNETQEFKFKTGGETTIECTDVAFDEGIAATIPATSIALQPTYDDCEELFGEPVTVHTNDCEYVLHREEGATTGTANIECPTATGIQITVGSICTYEIDSQTGLGSVTYKNVGMSSTQEVELQPNVTGITSTRTTSDFPFICPNGSAEGTYTGSFVLTGEKEGGHAAVFVD